MKHKAGHSSNIERYTPREIFEGLNTIFDLDPCCPKKSVEPIPAHDYCKKWYSLPEENGLKLPWKGLVWLNPPFARGVVGQWISKAREHNNCICLVTSYFTSKWFYDNPPDGIYLLNFRPRYEVPKNNKSTVTGLYASLLISYGIKATHTLSKSTLGGSFFVAGECWRYMNE